MRLSTRPPVSLGRKFDRPTKTLRGGKPLEALKLESGTVSSDHGWMTLTTQLEAGRTWFLISGIVSLVSLASAGTVGLRSAVRPRSSAGCTSALSWLMNGRLASTVAGVLFSR